MTRKHWLDTVGPPPKGYTIIERGVGYCTIQYRWPVLLHLLLGVCWMALGVVCVWLLWAYSTGWKAANGDTIPFWFVAVFWVIELVVGHVLLQQRFGRTTLRLAGNELISETCVFGMRKRRVISKETIRRKMQKAGDGTVAPSDWFGQVLAAWVK